MTHHERKGNKGQTSDLSVEHEHLTVGDKDDSEILEDAATLVMITNRLPRASDATKTPQSPCHAYNHARVRGRIRTCRRE